MSGPVLVGLLPLPWNGLADCVAPEVPCDVESWTHSGLGVARSSLLTAAGQETLWKLFGLELPRLCKQLQPLALDCEVSRWPVLSEQVPQHDPSEDSVAQRDFGRGASQTLPAALTGKRQRQDMPKLEPQVRLQPFRPNELGSWDICSLDLEPPFCPPGQVFTQPSEKARRVYIKLKIYREIKKK